MTRAAGSCRFVLLACCVVALLADAAAAAPPKAALDAAVDAVIARYRPPGLAVGVVQGGEIVYVRTAGETLAGSGQAVTPATIFKIASNTKAMTTGALARLVETGKLRWGDPVARYLPGFRMYDPWVTREMQVRDLLVHNSGLREGAGDLMLWPEPNRFTRADVLAGLAHLKPVHSFRSHYDYDNLLYIVAGEVAAAAAGMPYEELIRREVFVPVGLEHCRVGEWRRDEAGSVAQPHVLQDGRYLPEGADGEIVPPTTMAAAGGVRCSLDDLLRWVRMWLDPGVRPPGSARSWISPAQRDILWSAHMPRPVSERDQRWNRTRFSAYGYGWRLSDVDGEWRVAHTGTLSGMYSAITLLPDRSAGFVFLINGDAEDARQVLNQAIVKILVAGTAAPSADFYADDIAREEAAPESSLPPPPRSPLSPADAAGMLGVYRDPWFGEASLCTSGDRIRFQSAKSPMLGGFLMRSGPRMLVEWDDLGADAEAWLDGSQATAGSAGTLTLSKVDPEADFSYDFEDLLFTRVRDCL